MSTPKEGRDRRSLITWVLAGVVLGLIVGLATGAIVTARTDDGEQAAITPSPTESPAAVASQDVCVEAVQEAQTELQARNELLAVGQKLETLANRATTALRGVDTAELENVLTDLETLGKQMDAAAGEMRSDATFQSLADGCLAASGS